MKIKKIRKGDVLWKRIAHQDRKLRVLYIFDKEKIPQVVLKCFHRGKKEFGYFIESLPSLNKALAKGEYFIKEEK